MASIKTFVKSHLYLNALAYVFYLTVKVRLRTLYGDYKTNSGTKHMSLQVNESVDYIKAVFSNYCRIAGFSDFKGKSVLELGPGDSAGVGLLFLAHGAKNVDLADKFYARRVTEHQNIIYKELVRSYKPLEKMLKIKKVIDIPENHPNLKRYYGPASSAEKFLNHNRKYDVIVSSSVLEHIDNPEFVLKKMYEALNPGGFLIHKVDLRDHGMFAPHISPIKFLEIPQWIYTLMISGTGYPNRFLFHRYKQTLSKLDLNCTFYIASLHGIEEDLSSGYLLEDIPKNFVAQSTNLIERSRQNFCRSLLKIPAEDLMVSEFFLVCKKNKKIT